MPDYRVFGGDLRSELALPELPLVNSSSPHWCLRVGPHGAAPVCDHDIASDEIADGIVARLSQTAESRAILFDDTGRFDVAPDGREMCWRPSPTADVALARIDVLGRVFALALHQANHLVLHGSAVSYGGHAIGFLADKGSGKSTLALGLVGAGARLITDDTLAIDVASGMVLPGVQAVRLWDDAAAAVSEGARGEVGAGGKLEFRELGAAQLEGAAVPLAALYLLRRADVPGGGPVRQRLDGVAGALALIGQAKLGGLVRGALAQETMARAAILARTVPVYTLAMPHGFDLLQPAVATVLDWHRRP